MHESKEIRAALAKCRVRVMDAERELMTESPHVLSERRFLSPGSPERGCYQAGYLAALQDLMSVLEGGDFPRRSTLPSPSSPGASSESGTSRPSRP